MSFYMEFLIDIGYVYTYIYIYKQIARERERLVYGLDDRGSVSCRAVVSSLRRRVRDGCGVHLFRTSYPAVRAVGRGAGRPPPCGAGTGNAWSCASSPRFFMACLIKQ
jgi:hypothetical protein